MQHLFTRIASRAAHVMGQPTTFIVAAGFIVVWAASGPLLQYSDTWQLIVNTATTVMTFLAVFLIQNSQNRDGAAMQAKLDEILRVLEKARNEFVGIEHLTDAEIGQIKEALRAEQKQVRTMIDRLRDSEQDEHLVDLSASMRRVLEELSVRWAIEIAGPSAAPIMAPLSLDYEIGNLLREAVANAVRHGKASEVAVSVEATGKGIVIEVVDNGAGFAAGTGPEAPRSIRERTRRHGGELSVRSGPDGTHLVIELPLETAA